ncbi:MAG: hypothetical protein ACRDTH_12535 [Pseudonocardiaceae bacterium]
MSVVCCRRWWLALAVGVYETGAVRLTVLSAYDDELPGDRFAGGAVPLLPLFGSVWFPVGVEEQVRAEGAASVLHLQQA